MVIFVPSASIFILGYNTFVSSNPLLEIYMLSFAYTFCLKLQQLYKYGK